MNTYMIFRRSGWASHDELEKAAARSAKVSETEMADRVLWIRSYVTAEPNNRLGCVCIYQATDQDAIKEHARRANLPCDTIVPVAKTLIVHEDPQPVR